MQHRRHHHHHLLRATKKGPRRQKTRTKVAAKVIISSNTNRNRTQIKTATILVRGTSTKLRGKDPLVVIVVFLASQVFIGTVLQPLAVFINQLWEPIVGGNLYLDNIY